MRGRCDHYRSDGFTIFALLRLMAYMVLSRTTNLPYAIKRSKQPMLKPSERYPPSSPDT